MKEFIDKDRKIVLEYYQIQESFTGNNIKATITKLKKLIKNDSYFLDTYLFLYELLEYIKEQYEAESILEQAYEKALELILDEKGNWPDKLEWGWIENRHIIRTLINKGILFWKQNKTDEALGVFQNLLRTNPNDNGGVRYFILGISEGMTKNEFNKKFDKDGYWDQEIDEWFNNNAKNYKQKFDWWFKQLEY